MFKASLSSIAFVAIIGVSNAIFQIPNQDSNEYYTITETKTTYDQGVAPVVQGGSYVQTNQMQTGYGYGQGGSQQVQAGYGQGGSNGQMQIGYGQGGINGQMQGVGGYGQNGYQQTNHYQTNNHHYGQTVTKKPGCSGLLGCMMSTAANIAGSAVGTVLTAGGGLVGAAMGGPEMGIKMAHAGNQLGVGLGRNIADTAGQIGI